MIRFLGCSAVAILLGQSSLQAGDTGRGWPEAAIYWHSGKNPYVVAAVLEDAFFPMGRDVVGTPLGSRGDYRDCPRPLILQVLPSTEILIDGQQVDYRSVRPSIFVGDIRYQDHLPFGDTKAYGHVIRVVAKKAPELDESERQPVRISITPTTPPVPKPLGGQGLGMGSGTSPALTVWAEGLNINPSAMFLRERNDLHGWPASINDRTVVIELDNKGRVSLSSERFAYLCCQSDKPPRVYYYVWNPAAKRFDDRKDRARLLIATLPKERADIYREFCRAYAKDWNTIRFEERLWVHRFVSAKEREEANFIQSLKQFAAVLPVVALWMAPEAPSNLCGALSAAHQRRGNAIPSGDKEVTIAGTVIPAKALTPIKWKYLTPAAIVPSLLPQCFTDPNGAFSFKCEGNREIIIWANDRQVWSGNTENGRDLGRIPK